MGAGIMNTVRQIGRLRGARVLRVAVFSALALGAAGARALTITNVMPVNVTPSSFTILCRTGEPATPSISVFADPVGVTNLAGQLSLDGFPLHTGNPDMAEPYSRRLNQSTIRQRTQNSGFVQVRVSECRPDTTYYYQLRVTGTNGQTVTWPASGPLPSVRTMRENAFVAHATQLLLDIPAGDVLGRVVTLAHPNAAYPLAAIVGDGCDTNQVFFNLSDLFAQLTRANFLPVGDQQFTVSVLGTGAEADTLDRYTLNFTTELAVADTQYRPVSGFDYLQLTVGSTVVRAGQTGSVQLTVASSGGVDDLSLTMVVPSTRLTAFSIQSLTPDISQAYVFPITGDLLGINFYAASGRALQGTQLVARLDFMAVSNQTSGFVPLRIDAIAAYAGPKSILNLFGQNGRVAVVGEEPLLEAGFGQARNRLMSLYGKPGSSYAVQYSTNLGAGWSLLQRVPLTNLVQFVDLNRPDNIVFFRAFEFKADPPLMEAGLAPNRNLSLLVYGKPGNQFALESATSLSGVVSWAPTPLTFTLTNSFRFMEAPGPSNPSGNIFYRIRQQ